MKYFTLLLGIFFTSSVLAQEFTVKEVRYDKKIIYIFPNETQANTQKCDVASPFIVSDSEDGFEQMYSMSLAALASGKKMQCWFSGCAKSAWGNTRPKVYACGIKSQ